MGQTDPRLATLLASHIAEQLLLDAVMTFRTADTPFIGTGTIVTGTIIDIGTNEARQIAENAPERITQLVPWTHKRPKHPRPLLILF